MPSLTSKLTLVASSFITCGILYYVHYKQVYDRTQLHRGIELDNERRDQQKRVNVAMMQKQSELTRAYREHQEISENK
jgi:hypothetical protein